MPGSSRAKRSGRAFWDRTIRQWRTEGAGSVRAFCRKRGVKESAFYFWRRKLGEESSAAAGSPGRTGSAFVPVRVVGSGALSADAVIEVVFPCGTVLRAGPGADGAMLQDVLSALRAPSPGAGDSRPC